MKILIVEDEEAIAEGLKINFEHEGYEAVIAADGPTALAYLDEDLSGFDLVILDLMLPCMSGYEACREIRARDEHLPILVLSARTLSEDKSQAFDCGSDQYMTKPFALAELLSRVRNLLARRSGSAAADAARDRRKIPAVFRFDGITVDFEKFLVTVEGSSMELTTMELDLLRYFIQNEGIVLSRAQILRDVWSESPDIVSRTVDNFVMRLRKIFEKNPASPRYIVSIRGTGYRFSTSDDSLTN
ncbi:MAG: response regulator transcription factor [Planctomycetes bacterium]|nr:response regulator transcription factor [Planctomycetota bacterium]